jgi:hypothetical protein
LFVFLQIIDQQIAECNEEGAGDDGASDGDEPEAPGEEAPAAAASKKGKASAKRKVRRVTCVQRCVTLGTRVSAEQESGGIEPRSNIYRRHGFLLSRVRISTAFIWIS